MTNSIPSLISSSLKSYLNHEEPADISKFGLEYEDFMDPLLSKPLIATMKSEKFPEIDLLAVEVSAQMLECVLMLFWVLLT